MHPSTIHRIELLKVIAEETWQGMRPIGIRNRQGFSDGRRTPFSDSMDCTGEKMVGMRGLE
jgi:hypothetical protein